jgi:NADPH-dependent F420 reductase
MRVAVVGGTGPFGSALARRLVDAGFDVTIGSRDADRAATTAAEVGAARGAANAEAVTEADLVVLAVNASAVLATAAELDEAIGETPVLVVASELRFASGVAFPSDNPLSLAARTQQLLRAPVVAGLHSLAAGSLAAGAVEGDTLVFGDNEAAKALALELAEKLVTGRALDGGPLAGARALEDMCAAIVNLNKRYGGHGGLRIVGL